jgi:aldehyde:ferredoxin oxidoreductase
MNGFHNKVLHINLTTRSFHEEPLGDEILGSYLGGKGLGTYLLLRNSKAGADPLSEDNPLVFATGPATNTQVWGSSRYGVFTKSPQTGLFAESYSGGKVAEPMSKTGYDAIVIEGASRDPVYLDISDGNVAFVDAPHIWGKDTYEAEDTIRDEINDRGAGIVVIGPAGENLVRFAVIENNYWRSSGRTGVGAVMGSKKVKGIAFRGTKQKSIADPDLLADLWRATRDRGKDDPGIDKYRQAGTLQLVPVMNKLGAFPTEYWKAGTYDKWQNLTIDALRDSCQVRVSACSKCFIGCGKRSEVLQGRHKGLQIEGPEYETVFSFGGLCLIDDIREIMYLNDICDRLGMDTITAGNLAGLAIEASSRGAISEKYAYGDVDGIASLLHAIARKEGIGATLAEGIKHASREWGVEDLAIHVKGLEPAGYEPRVLKGMGLSYATSPRGACHLRATFYKPELAGMIDPDQIEGKAELFSEWEDRHVIIDSLVLCKFFRDLYLWDELSTLILATTGMDLDKNRLRTMASNILNMVREFNLREGMRKADEMLPRRFFEEKLADSGKLLPKSDFEKMMSDYYRTRGWSEPADS